MICAHDKATPPKVQPPMPDGEHQPNELTLIGRQRAVERRDGAAEERQLVLVLQQHGAESVS